jgi:cysteine-rich repeat protein
LPGEEETGASEETSTGAEEASSESTSDEGVCGDGVVDGGEGCDDGNRADDDACPSGSEGQCKAEAVCGDGIVRNEAEACDDGNDVEGDGCEKDCTVTPTATCGNGVVEGTENCDDGNTKDEDGCLGTCEMASCGDGVVWAGMEGCDDGNESDEDGCPSGAAGQCAGEAKCGDGLLWAGMEGCDDGNESDADGCPSGEVGQCAEEARCGDGILWAGAEECDDADGDDLDECNDDCATPRWVFITSTNGPNNNGVLGGVAGADAHCQSLADAEGLGGTYMAWLTGSDAGSAPAVRFASTEFRGWYLLPTDPPTGVARGWQDLVSPNDDMPANYLQAAIVVDEQANSINSAFPWSNTTSAGTQKDSTNHCMDWTTDAAGQNGHTGRSAAGVVDNSWTDDISLPCGVGARLYCFQVG